MPSADLAKIAVIIPVYNITSFLEEAIRSVAIQDYPQKEIIVIDDGSSPENAIEIERICRAFSDIKLLKQPNAGAANARSKGAKQTSAELVLFLDADDTILPGALAYLAEALRNNPDAIAAYARSIAIDAQGNIITDKARPDEQYIQKDTDVLSMLLERKDFILNGSICMRRDAFNNIAPPNSDLKYDEDWVLLCHLALSGNIIPAGDQIIHHRRRHPDSMSASPVHTRDFRFSEAMKAYKAVYLHPAFMQALGEDKLRVLYEKRVAIAHFRMTRAHLKKSNREEMLFHFNSINKPLSLLFESEGNPG